MKKEKKLQGKPPTQAQVKLVEDHYDMKMLRRKGTMEFQKSSLKTCCVETHSNIFLSSSLHHSPGTVTDHRTVKVTPHLSSAQLKRLQH